MRKTRTSVFVIKDKGTPVMLERNEVNSVLIRFMQHTLAVSQFRAYVLTMRA